MRNAKDEFINTVKGEHVICAIIEIGYDDTESVTTLKRGFSLQDYQDFLRKINISYDAGYGRQELYGTIWCENGVWFTRGEYDGSEWWERHEYPEILKELN